MGIAIAAAAARRGASVTLSAANVALDTPAGVRRIDVETTAELQRVAATEFPSSQILLMAAAPADFRPETAAEGKLSREGSIDLHLQPTEDILAGLVTGRAPGQTIVGFAAEHGGDAVTRARDKLSRKGADLIVLNDVSDPRIGFESTENEVTLVAAEDEVEVPRTGKDAVAEAILDRVERLRAATGSPGPHAA